MGVQERRNREKTQRREDIMRVARELILARGVEGFSLQDVANALEISKGTIYLSFPGKDDILHAILFEAGKAFLDFLSERVEKATSGLDALIAMGRGYFDFYRNQEDAFVLFGLKDYFAPAFPFVRRTIFEELPDVFMALVRGCLDRGVKDGSLDSTLDPETMTVSIVFMATSLVDKVAKIPRDLRAELDVSSVIGSAFGMLVRAVANPAIPRNLIERCFEAGAGIDLAPYWRNNI